MNIDTGIIRTFADDEEAMASGFAQPLGRMPNPVCNRCNGTGSRKNHLGRFVPCRCTEPKGRDKRIKP